jgi:hypothetical protein
MSGKHPPVQASHFRSDNVASVTFTFKPPFNRLPPDKRLEALAAIAADLRQMIEQIDEERLAIAEAELSA